MLSRTVSAAAARDGRMTTRLFLAIFALIQFGLLFSLPALAQSTAGRILGTVSDQSGAAVPGATVTVTDTERGTSRTLTTDESGGYVAPDLRPGTYKIRAEMKGFKTTRAAKRSGRSRDRRAR